MKDWLWAKTNLKTEFLICLQDGSRFLIFMDDCWIKMLDLNEEGEWLRGRGMRWGSLISCSGSRTQQSLGILHFHDWYRTQRQFIRLWLKNCLGACAPLFVQQNTKGFQHSSTVTRNQAAPSHPAVICRLFTSISSSASCRHFLPRSQIKLQSRPKRTLKQAWCTPSHFEPAVPSRLTSTVHWT